MQDNGQQAQTVQVVTAQGTAQPGTIYVVATEGTDNNVNVKFEQVEQPVSMQQVRIRSVGVNITSILETKI